jgi:uncharacterized membrane protein
MNSAQRLGAAIGYIPVVGWLYVLLTQQNNKFAIFHVRQAIGLVLYLALIFVIWAVFTWIISWIPYGFLIGNALFALVLAAFLFGLIALISGIVNASRGKPSVMPIFGRRSLRLPIGNLQ